MSHVQAGSQRYRRSKTALRWKPMTWCQRSTEMACSSHSGRSGTRRPSVRALSSKTFHSTYRTLQVPKKSDVETHQCQNPPIISTQARSYLSCLAWPGLVVVKAGLVVVWSGGCLGWWLSGLLVVWAVGCLVLRLSCRVVVSSCGCLVVVSRLVVVLSCGCLVVVL